MSSQRTGMDTPYLLDGYSPSEHPDERGSLDAPAKLTQAKLNKRFRDADLSKDKSGPKSSPKLWRSWFLALGWHLEEIHVTWAHLEKKQRRLRTYTKFIKSIAYRSLRGGREKGRGGGRRLSSVDVSVDTPHKQSKSSMSYRKFQHLLTLALNELIEYENVGMLRRERAINSFDRDDLAFECMIGFRKFIAYFDPFLPMNIITRKAYNTIMVDRLESIGKNLVAVVRDVYVFVGSFTYITYFVVLEDIG
ncbi:hypothetical protein Tco_0027472 [Tanacetum coccineum]